jgi:hypothetical protein
MDAHVDKSTSIRYCAACNDEAVYPFDWDEHGETMWWVIARCGNCDTYREVILTNEEVEDWDIWLDDTADEIMREYKKLVRENMKDEIKRFSKLLELDIIMPDDFGP